MNVAMDVIRHPCMENSREAFVGGDSALAYLTFNESFAQPVLVFLFAAVQQMSLFCKMMLEQLNNHRKRE